VSGIGGGRLRTIRLRKYKRAARATKATMTPTTMPAIAGTFNDDLEVEGWAGAGDEASGIVVCGIIYYQRAWKKQKRN
jgi:hypothetical protein